MREENEATIQENWVRPGSEGLELRIARDIATAAVALSHVIEEAGMGRHSHRPPENATVEKTYDGLEELLRAFAGGSIPLLVVVAPPKPGKRRRVREAVRHGGHGLGRERGHERESLQPPPGQSGCSASY